MRRWLRLFKSLRADIKGLERKTKAQIELHTPKLAARLLGHGYGTGATTAAPSAASTTRPGSVPDDVLETLGSQDSLALFEKTIRIRRAHPLLDFGIQRTRITFCSQVSKACLLMSVKQVVAGIAKSTVQFLRFRRKRPIQYRGRRL